jgi:glutathione S-transferase
LTQVGTMKLFAFPASSRVIAIDALIRHLDLPCEKVRLDVLRGDLLTQEYLALNPNHKVPTLVHGDFVLWESNAILAYVAAQRSESGLWPTTARAQADVMRWLLWEAAHLDAESWGMVVFERASRGVLGLGPGDPTFIARGEQNFSRFAAVLNRSLTGRRWLLGDRLTIADFAVGKLWPPVTGLGLPIREYSEIGRWYDRLAQLPAWQGAMADWKTARDEFVAALSTGKRQAAPDFAVWDRPGAARMAVNRKAQPIGVQCEGGVTRSVAAPGLLRFDVTQG